MKKAVKLKTGGVLPILGEKWIVLQKNHVKNLIVKMKKAVKLKTGSDMVRL